MKLTKDCLEPVIVALQSLGIELACPSSTPTNPGRDAFGIRASVWVLVSTLVDMVFT